MIRRFTYRSRFPVPAAELFAWHARPGAFERLQPPGANIRVLERQGTIRSGDRLVMEIRQGPIALRWVAVHEAFIDGQQFADRQVEGPFTFWLHTHRVRPDGPDASVLEDDIEYVLPGGPFGDALGHGFADRMLGDMFRWRHERTRADLARHAAVAGRGPLRIAVTGASGLVGTALVPFLTTGGHHVDMLVRRAARPGSSEIAWDPAAGTLDAAALDGVDAVIHLAGENIGDGRWDAARKQRIVESRVRSTTLLAETLARLPHPPRVWLSASAIGVYGNRGAEWVDEATPPGSGFLADVCKQWEAATAPARAAGIRVVTPRFGVILSRDGGALAKMLPPFRLGLGGVVGSGQQYLSWVTLDDAVAALHHLLFTESLSGAVNVVAPAPATNAAFTHALGQVLHRPTVVPLPEVVVRTLFGEMGEALLLEGARVRPTQLAASGFDFLHPELVSALRAVIGR